MSLAGLILLTGAAQALPLRASAAPAAVVGTNTAFALQELGVGLGVNAGLATERADRGGGLAIGLHPGILAWCCSRGSRPRLDRRSRELVERARRPELQLLSPAGRVLGWALGRERRALGSAPGNRGPRRVLRTAPGLGASPEAQPARDSLLEARRAA